jgi:RNA polymerase sigma factor (sigma-70 family)
MLRISRNRSSCALPRYRERGTPFVAWLFRIARNTLTDHYRRRRSTVAWDLVPEILQPTASWNLEEDAIQREAADALRVLVRALDADTRELLALRFGARLTVGEIAAVLGKGEAATRKRLARTLHILADQFFDVIDEARRAWRARLSAEDSVAVAAVPAGTFRLNAPATARVVPPHPVPGADAKSLMDGPTFTALAATCGRPATEEEIFRLKRTLADGQSLIAACQRTAASATAAGLVAALLAPNKVALDDAMAAG